MPQTQSRVRRRNNASRSNRGPRAGRSGSRPAATRRARGTGTRDRGARAGNAAARPRRGSNAQPGRRPAAGAAGRSRGRGLGDGLDEDLWDFQAGGRPPDEDTLEARERRANERRLRQDHPSLFGRQDE